MPATVSLYLIAVWFCVGVFTGMGWALGAWVMAKVCGLIDSAAASKA